MHDALPPVLAAVIDRIAAPEGRGGEPPDDVTGELSDLLSWWRTLAPDAPITPEWLSPPAPDDVIAAVAQGVADADRAIDRGATLLVPRASPRDDTAARTVIALLTRKESSVVVHQGVGVSDREWMRRCAIVRDRAADAMALRASPLALLGAVAAPGIASVAGMLLAAAARRTPCLVEGTDELAAALVADRICYRAKGWWRCGSDSPDGGRAAAVDRVDLAAGLHLRLTDDVGRGAQATLALLAGLVPTVAPQ